MRWLYVVGCFAYGWVVGDCVCSLVFGSFVALLAIVLLWFVCVYVGYLIVRSLLVGGCFG